MSDVALEGFGGGGGASLNFKVKDYATEELLMAATGKDNEIGIITSTPMTGWYFAAEQPENMQPGEVWISTGTASPVEFDALKKHTVMVYPLSAQQFVTDKLIPVDAYIVRNGEWIQFSFAAAYLFDNGDDFKNLTGGWSKSGYTISGFNREDNSKVTIGNTIVCQAVSGSTTDYGGACGTVNKINKDNYTKLRVKGSVSGYQSEARLYVGVNTSKSLNASPTAKISLTANGNFDKTLTLPSATSFYVFVLAACLEATEVQYTASLTVNSISLE